MNAKPWIFRATVIATSLAVLHCGSDDDTGGTAGTGGIAGTSGTAGTGGTSGTSGSGGTGGATDGGADADAAQPSAINLRFGHFAPDGPAVDVCIALPGASGGAGPFIGAPMLAGRAVDPQFANPRRGLKFANLSQYFDLASVLSGARTFYAKLVAAYGESPRTRDGGAIDVSNWCNEPEAQLATPTHGPFEISPSGYTLVAAIGRLDAATSVDGGASQFALRLESYPEAPIVTDPARLGLRFMHLAPGTANLVFGDVTTADGGSTVSVPRFTTTYPRVAEPRFYEADPPPPGGTTLGFSVMPSRTPVAITEDPFAGVAGRSYVMVAVGEPPPGTVNDGVRTRLGLLQCRNLSTDFDPTYSQCVLWQPRP